MEHAIDLSLEHLGLHFLELLLLDDEVASHLVLELLILVHESFAALEGSLEERILASGKEAEGILERLGVDAHTDDVLVTLVGSEAET